MVLKMKSIATNKLGHITELILKKKGDKLLLISARFDTKGETVGIEIMKMEEQQVAILHRALEGLYPDIIEQQLGDLDHDAVKTFVELWDDIGDDVDPSIFKIE